MKDTTLAMHRSLGRAVLELRARMDWSQADLAKKISKQGTRARMVLEPDQETISRWERGQQAPSPAHRMALAKIAAKYRHEELANIFRAHISVWRVLGGCAKIGLMKDKDE